LIQKIPSLIPNLNQQKYCALIDTGASVSSIYSDLAVSLGLQMHNKASLSGIRGVQEFSSYMAQVYVPRFRHTILGSFLGVHLSGGTPIILYLADLL